MPKIRKDNKKPRICPVCGIVFIYKRKSFMHCSRKCGGISRKNGITKSCIICKKGFYVSRAASLGVTNCCSMKCRGEWWGDKLLSNRKIPMSFYASGAAFERKALVNLVEHDGCNLVTRSPQSRGVFDAYGMKFNEDDIELFLVQVKALKGTKTVNTAVNKKERTVMMDRIMNNTYRVWANSKKIIGKPTWANKVHFEIWIYEKRKELHKFRLNLDNLEWVKR